MKAVLPCFDSQGMGGSSTNSLHHNQDLLRAHQGTPVMNQGPKAGEAAQGVTSYRYLCTVGISAAPWEGVAHHFPAPKNGAKHREVFHHEELSKKELFGVLQVIFALGHTDI